MCNFPAPTATKPSLLGHGSVVTLFHELGHGIHDLVAQTKYSRFHGTSTVRDFVEVPSQMLENWVWEPSQLKALSQHYSYLSPEYKAEFERSTTEVGEQPPERVADDVMQKIVQAGRAGSALSYLYDLKNAIFDMTVHQPASHAAIEALPLSETYNRLNYDLIKFDKPEGGGWDYAHAYVNFNHLIAVYDAGYYGYLR